MSLFENCVGYWDMSTNANDIMNIRGATTLTNASQTNDDRFKISNHTYTLTDAGKISFASAYSIAEGSPFTFVLWYKGTSVGSIESIYTYEFIGASSPNIRMKIYNTNKLAAIVYSGAWRVALSTTTINDGSWHMLALTQGSTGGTTRVYVDGVSEGSIAYVSSGSGATSFNAIGANQSTTATAGDYGECMAFSSDIGTGGVKALYDLTSKKYIYPYQRGERWCE